MSTAWFTIAFLLYSENQSGPEMVLPVQGGSDLNKRDVAEARRPGRVEPFQKENRADEEDRRNEVGGEGVLLPPQNGPGEMGKPVVIPTNMTGNMFEVLLKFKHSIVARLYKSQSCFTPFTSFVHTLCSFRFLLYLVPYRIAFF